MFSYVNYCVSNLRFLIDFYCSFLQVFNPTIAYNGQKESKLVPIKTAEAENNTLRKTTFMLPNNAIKINTIAKMYRMTLSVLPKFFFITFVFELNTKLGIQFDSDCYTGYTAIGFVKLIQLLSLLL